MSTAFRMPCDEGVIRAGCKPSPCARRREPWILAVSVMASSMAFIDGMVVNLALPRIQAELEATMADAQWIVEAYALFLAALILLGGSLGDQFGRRKVFLLGVGCFAVASAWCGLAPTVEQLIFARGFQGVAAALLVPGSLALLSASFPEERRGRAIGIWSGFTAISTGLGPVLGGWLVENMSWRWAFYINLPLAAFVVAAALWQVPESRDESGSRSLDWLGACLSTLGLGLIVFGLIEAGAVGLEAPLVVGCVAAGVVSLIAFVVHESRTPNPMMPLSLFRSKSFSGANLLTLFLYAALSTVFFFLPFNLIQVQGYSATEAGAALMPAIVITFVLSRWSGSMMDRFGGKLPLTVGPLLTAGGYVLCAMPEMSGSYWTTFFPAILVFGTGMAVAVAPLTTTVMNAAPAEKAGAASGVNNAVSRAAGLLAIAVFSVVVSTSFNRSLDERLGAIQLPAAVIAELDQSRPLLAAARAPASLEPGLRGEVETAIDLAFVDAFRLVAVLAAALALLSALSAALLLEPRRSEPAPQPGRPADVAAAS